MTTARVAALLPDDVDDDVAPAGRGGGFLCCGSGSASEALGRCGGRSGRSAKLPRAGQPTDGPVKDFETESLVGSARSLGMGSGIGAQRTTPFVTKVDLGPPVVRPCVSEPVIDDSNATSSRCRAIFISTLLLVSIAAVAVGVFLGRNDGSGSRVAVGGNGGGSEDGEHGGKSGSHNALKGHNAEQQQQQQDAIEVAHGDHKKSRQLSGVYASWAQSGSQPDAQHPVESLSTMDVRGMPRYLHEEQVAPVQHAVGGPRMLQRVPEPSLRQGFHAGAPPSPFEVL
mmetsp:Transcript_16995/g.38600  ORF Transcript_16995/g.38600 Transcript_16995/m.38600 type:complete len:284 (-) Transcript_16995:71-922(-)